jgi:type I restriction enzyme R subunit
VLESEEQTREFLDAQTALASWFALARTQPAVIELREEVGFFNRLAAEVRKIATPEAQASTAAEQAVRQFMSEGLAAGEVVDVLGLADDDRPELSVLSDEFLDSLPGKTEHRNVQVRLLEKLLNDEIKARMRTNRIHAQRFGERVQDVLRRYELKQLTSAEVVKRLVEIAKELRDAHHRHEQLGLTDEEAAFYDAIAGGAEHVTANPDLAAIAHELVESIRKDLTVDWTDREATQAKVRTKIKRLLRRHRKELTKALGGGGPPHDLDYYTDLILEQARGMYRYWPEVGDRLFA